MDDRPSTLNQTERAAWEWLTETQGYDPTEIRRDDPKQVPDFECPDGHYEAKYANQQKAGPPKVVITRRQYERLDESGATILVFTDTDAEPIETFPWREREGAGVEISYKWRQSNTTRPPEVNDKAMAKLDVFRSQIAAEIGYKPPVDRTIEAIFTAGIRDGRLVEDAHERVQEELEVPETPFG